MWKQRFKRSPNGFTLIETMVIVAIIGMLAGLGVPALSQYVQRQRVVGARNTLIADIQYARSLAIARRATYRIDFGATQYQIIENGPENVVKTATAPDGVTYAAGANPNFYPWGLTDPVNIVVGNPRKSSNVNLLPNGTVSHD